MDGYGAAVSVVVVSDYGGRTAEDWNYLRDTLGALGRPDGEHSHASRAH